MSNPKTLAQIRAETADRLYRGGDIDGCEYDSFVEGFDAGAKAVMDEAEKLAEILLKQIEFFRTDSGQELEIRQTLDSWNKFKEELK